MKNVKELNAEIKGLKKQVKNLEKEINVLTISSSIEIQLLKEEIQGKENLKNHLSDVKTKVKTKKQPEKIEFKGLTLRDYGTWFTRKTRTGDLDSNGEQILTPICFCLKNKEVEEKNTEAYPLLYDIEHWNTNKRLVGYKVPKIINWEKGKEIKNKLYFTYCRHTCIVADSKNKIGFVGSWATVPTKKMLKAYNAEKV